MNRNIVENIIFKIELLNHKEQIKKINEEYKNKIKTREIKKNNGEVLILNAKKKCIRCEQNQIRYYNHRDLRSIIYLIRDNHNIDMTIHEAKYELCQPCFWSWMVGDGIFIPEKY